MTSDDSTAAEREYGKAKQTQEEATYAIAGGFVHMAANRLYYTVSHYLKSVLLIDGNQTKSHKGAQNRFFLRFVKPGIFPQGDADLIARLWTDRQAADYGYLVDTDIPNLE